jgi:23S rRNA (uracil1939-C5)-methyltransferase
MQTDQTVVVDKLNRKGHGIASLNQKKVEVPYSLPGETYKVQLSKRKRKGAFRALSAERVEAHATRCTPKCRHFGACGGCVWQHMPYSDQLQAKQSTIYDLFSDYTSHIQSITPAPEEWRYRNKMEFSFSEDRQGNRYLGLCMPMSRGKVLNIEECHLVDPWILEVLSAVRTWWYSTNLPSYNGYNGTGLLISLTIRKSVRESDTCVMLQLLQSEIHLFAEEVQAQFLSCLQRLTTPPTTVCLAVKHCQKGSPTRVVYQHIEGNTSFKESLHVANMAPLQLEVSPSSFLQPNTKQAEAFYAKGLQMIGNLTNKIVYDLYSGTGTIGMLAARSAKKVVSIELHPEAVEDAKRMSALNHLHNITFMQGAVEEMLPKAMQEQNANEPSVVIVDPPRQGLGSKVALFLAEQKVEQILYISCNPVTQAEDLTIFCEKGYKPTCIQPVDQFPHTPHLENLILLQKQ